MEGQDLPKRRKLSLTVGLEQWWTRLKQLEAKEAGFQRLLDDELRRARVTN